MPATNIRGRQILDGDVSRLDLNDSTSTSAVIKKLLPTSDASITISYTGADVGTGDVTLFASKATSSQLGVMRVGSGLSVDSNGIVSVNSSGGITGSGTTNYVPKWTSGTALGNSLIFDNGTDILVGTTTNPYSGANYRSVSVYASSRAIFSMSHASSSTVGMMFYQSSQLNLFNTSDTAGIKVVAGFSFGGVGVILNPGSTSWSSTSDEKTKTDFKPIENGLNKVVSLRAITGRYKSDKDGTSRSFLIAQDVQSVLPEAVSINKEDGNLILRYTDVIPLLVASIKELKLQIDELKGNN